MGVENLLANKNLLGVERPEHGGDGWRFPGVLDFSANINPLGPSRSVVRAMRTAIGEVGSYPPPGEELRSALAEAHGVAPNCVVLGNGSSELIKVFCDAFISEGDAVLIPQPTYTEYEYFSRVRGAEVVEQLLAPIGESTPEIDTDVKAAFVCNPNNPTGSVLPLNRIEELAYELSRRRGILVVDEAYAEFSGLRSAAELIEAHDNLVVLRSMTKFYAIPGLRFGYAVASKNIAHYLSKLLPPWNINTVALHAALAALRDKEFAMRSRRYLSEEKRRLLSSLSHLPGLRVYPSEANFFLINIRKTGMSSREMKERLIDKGILIRDCSSFRHLGEEHVRVCVRKREENHRLISAMEELLDG